MTTKTSSTHRTLGIALIIALLAGLILAAPFLGIICLAALMAFLFYPAHQRIKKVIKNSGLSAVITFIFSGLIVLIPLTFTLILTISQVSTLTNSTSEYLATNHEGVSQLINQSVENSNTLLAPLNNHEAIITDQGVREFLSTALPAFARVVTDVIIGTVGNIPTAIVLTIMYIVFFFEFLVRGTKIIDLLRRISPFDKDTTSLYLKRVGLMTNAMAKGQLLISVIISFLSAILMIFLGLGEYFFLLFVIFTVLNMIPLGCGILFIPICVIAILLGNVVPGIIVLALYMIVSNLDSLIRPKIMPKGASLSAGLTMLAAFGGIGLFGLLGVVYGPILMIMVVTTIELYARQQKTA